MPLIVIEEHLGNVAVGPLLASPRCLDCVSVRRRANDRCAGKLTLCEADAADAWIKRVGQTHAHRRLIHAQVLVSPDGSVEWHPFLHLPGCPNAPLDGPADGCTTGPPAAVSSRVGIVRGFDVHEVLPGTVTVVALGASTLGSGGVPVLATGRGTSANPLTASAGALMEALEHYAAGFWPSLAKPEDVADETRFPDEDIPHRQYDWTPGLRARDGAPIWVPAHQVYIPFPDHPCRDRQQHSSGLAAGRTPRGAAARAIAECVERKLVHEVLSNGAAFEWARGDDDGTVLAGMGVCSEHYVVGCFSRRSDTPFVSMGFGSARGLDEAIEKSRREEVHVRSHMLMIRGSETNLNLASLTTMDALVVRGAFDSVYADGLWQRLMTTPAKTGTPSRAAPEVDIGVVDITPSDLAVIGVHVARAIQI